MKVFPLLLLDYDVLRRSVLGMGISETVSLAMMSGEIRKMVRMRDHGDVKIETAYYNGRCTMEVQYRDGTSSKMLLYECKNFPATTSASYIIGGFPFNISKTRNTCVIYTGEHYEDASIMLMEHLLTMFKSSKVHINVISLRVNVMRTMLTCEAFNYVQLITIDSNRDSSEVFERVLLEKSTSPQSRKLLSEYRPMIGENHFRTESAKAWIEDLHKRECPKFQVRINMDAAISNQVALVIQSWQQGATPFFQNLILELVFDENCYRFPHLLSIFDRIEPSNCWDTNGKRREFDKKRGFLLKRGCDLRRPDGNCLSIFLHKHSNLRLDSGLLLEFVVWKPNNGV